MQPVQTNLIGASATLDDDQIVIIAAVAMDDRGKYKILVIGEQSDLFQAPLSGLKITAMPEDNR